MAEIDKVNWVICPKCKFRYYVGPQLLVVEGALSTCPKCHHDFDAKDHLEKKFSGVTASDKWY